MEEKIEPLNEIINILNGLLNDKKYIKDYSLINDLKNKILYIKNNEYIDLDELESLNNNLKYIEEEYNDILDLTYYFDPIYIKIKKENQKRVIEELRKSNRKKKEGNLNV